MKTTIYMVRHGESSKTEGSERTRGLTDKGWADAKKLSEILKPEGITAFYSSPYTRAVQTIEGVAGLLNIEIVMNEDLRELDFSMDERIVSNSVVYPALESFFCNPEFSLPGGETSKSCENRSVAVLNEILNSHKGEKIVIGTHGLVMTLMMKYFNKQFDMDFLLKTTKPDIYKMEIVGNQLISTQRLWSF